ncbi:PIR Superfamily Protein [Plasmodium ovale wallikeri]|uniref:PIR Superfamily Protein n=2 Tax=Plasmodium ovale TaxID=36330 RepID=A0A1A9AGH3_PLAOA|nr:PIR Superfamily Protein [Plasmodium ovale wallikeri]SBT56075.1 PIR Superfamily Protein [Plasmodium ovale wallikeri]SBT74359.1 Plasmodium vivax Vir protein, putative [Plasmodium ovale]
MKEIKEEEQIPSKFYRELNIKADPSRLNGLSTTYSIINSFCNYSSVKTLLAKSLRNIELIRENYVDSATKRCRDVNYWFDKETETIQSEGERNSVSSCAISLFNEIKWKKQDPHGICKREKSIHATHERELRKNLDDFCEIRNNLRCTMLEGFNECSMYNNYIQKKKVDFLGKKNLCKDNSCKIDDKCKLANMDITFPSINCHELHNVKKEEQKEHITRNYSSLEIGFFLILSFLAFFLIFLFLSKMTPLGSLIRNYLIRRNLIKKKINEEEYDELLQYSFDSEPPDTVSRGYYVDYASLRN